MMDDRPQAADNSPSLTSPAMKVPKSEDSGASISAGAKAATVGRLIGERAFHLGASTFAGVISSRAPRSTRHSRRTRPPQPTLRRKPIRRAKASSLLASREMRPCRRNPWRAPFRHLQTRRPRRQSPLARARLQSNRASLTRAAAHEAGRSGQKPEGSAPPPVVRAASPASPAEPAESSAKTADGRPPDPTPFGATPTAQTSPFGAQLSAPFVAGALFEADVVDDESRKCRRRAPHERGRPRLSAFSFAGQGDRRRSLAGRPRERLDDDAAYRRQAFCRHPRRELSDPGLNRRRARRDRRSNGGDRPAARLAHCQADGRQHGWECEQKRVFR